MSILLDQGFPVEYELDEFNTPHTGTTFSRLQYWLCRLRCKIPLRHPATSSLDFLETFTLLPKTTRTTNSWVTTTFLISTSKHDFCYTYDDISHSHIQQCLNLMMHIFAQALSCQNAFSTLYQLHFVSLLLSFLRDLQLKRKPFIPCCH